MANYSIVSNAKFTPFSFDEMVKPFQMYGEYYAQQELLASKLAEDAALIRSKISNADTDTLETYNKFEEELNTQSDKLLRQGLTPSLRAELQKLKTRYNTEINPIKDAYNWKIQQMQNEQEGKNKGLVYEGDAATTSLDTYRQNPTLTYRSADSNAGYARVANAAQAIAKGLASAQFNGNLDKYTKELLSQSGYDVSDVHGAINTALNDLTSYLSNPTSSNTGADTIVKTLLNNEVNAANIKDWNSNAKQEYLTRVAPALYNLIGEAKATPVEDFSARLKAQVGADFAEKVNNYRATKHAMDNYPEVLALEVAGKSNGSSNDYEYPRPDRVYSYDGKVQSFTDNGGIYQTGYDTYRNYTPLSSPIIDMQKGIVKFKKGDDLITVYPNAKVIEVNKKQISLNEDGNSFTVGDVNIIKSALLQLGKDILSNPDSPNQYYYGILSDGKVISGSSTLKRTLEGTSNPSTAQDTESTTDNTVTEDAKYYMGLYSQTNE